MSSALFTDRAVSPSRALDIFSLCDVTCGSKVETPRVSDCLQHVVFWHSSGCLSGARTHLLAPFSSPPARAGVSEGAYGLALLTWSEDLSALMREFYRSMSALMDVFDLPFKTLTWYKEWLLQSR